MNNLYKILIAAVLLVGAANTRAANIELFDWAFNVDGVTEGSENLSGGVGYYTPAAGDLAALAAAFDFSAFDFSTSPPGGGGGLGTIVITVVGAGSHYVGAFFDHEFDEPINSYFNENGAANNIAAIAAGQSWEIDEPGFVFGDIFMNLQAGALDNSNAVPAGLEDDVAMAMAFDFVLAMGEQAIIELVISDMAPASGFFLSHTDPDSDMTIYLSGTLDIGPVPMPEPGTLLLLSVALAGAGAARRRRTR